MSKTGWIAVVLLCASNAAWLVMWLGGRDEADVAPPTTIELEETIDELQDEIARLKQADPVLIGSASAPAVTPAEETAPATSPGTTPPPKPADDEAARTAAERARAETDRRNAAVAAATAMLRKVMQVEDPAQRAEGLREIGEALEGTDEMLIEYTLSALFSLRDAEVDKSIFQQVVQEHLRSQNGGIRRSALYALFSVEKENADLRVAIESAKDPAPVVRQHSARLLGLYGGRAIAGEAADAVVALLADENPRVRLGTLHGLSGLKVTPAVERKLIELSSASGQDPRVVYKALGELREKSGDVVEALFTGLDHEDRHVRLRAHQGLQRSVQKNEERAVAAGYAGRLEKFVNPKSQREALKLIVRYGDDGLAPQLDRFAENEMVDAGVRELAQKAADYLRQKKPAR